MGEWGFLMGQGGKEEEEEEEEENRKTLFLAPFTLVFKLDIWLNFKRGT